MLKSYTLHVLKPHQPTNSKLADSLIDLPGAQKVKIKVDEIDQKTTSIYIKIEGTKELTIESIELKLEELNCSLHSVDEVSISKSKIKGENLKKMRL